MSPNSSIIAVSTSPFGEHKDVEASNMAAEWGEIYEAYEAFYRFLPYLETLKQHPHLKPYVHNFNLSGSRMMDGRGFRYIDHPITSFRQTLQLLPALKNVTLFRPLFLGELDEIIHESNRMDSNDPLSTSSTSSARQSRSSECSKDLIEAPPRTIALTVIKHASIQYPTLSRLIALLLRLRQHRSLEIIVTQNSRASRNNLSELDEGSSRLPFRHLHNSLSRSSSLETVIISGLPSSALIELLSPSGIIRSLPPSVATFSIDAPADINTLVNLVQSLPLFPLSTGIKTLKIRSVEGDPTQLREECQKKGIRLALA